MRMFGTVYLVLNAITTTVMVAWLVVILSAPFIFPEKAAWTEGRIFPVIDNFEIIQARQFQPGESTILYVNFDKLRECRFVRSTFIRRDITGRLVDAEVTFLEDKGGEADTKPLGSYTAGPWLINVPVEELHTLVAYKVRHQCHLGWETVTKEEVHGGIDPRAASSGDIRPDRVYPSNSKGNWLLAPQSQEHN